MNEGVGMRLRENSVPAGECRVWLRYRDKDGYGFISFNGKYSRVHRVVWQLANGPIPDGLCVLHSCDNPPCLRLEHLFVGTHADNTLDKIKKGRHAIGDRHGSRTHPESILRGEQNGNAKLTQEKVTKIKTEYAAGGISQEALGRKNGVGQMEISRIVNGKRWLRAGIGGA